FFFSSRRRHTRWPRDWSSDVCSSDLFFRHRWSVVPLWNSSSTAVRAARLFGAPVTSAGLREERVHVGGELAVVLEEKAVGRVRRSEERRVGKGGRRGWSVEV